MKKALSVLIAILCISTTTIFSQEKKFVNLKRAKVAPKIDGILNDPAWAEAEEAKNFIQFRPDMGVEEEAHEKTIVKVTYDDNAVYFAAFMQDDPSKIMKQFTTRDNFGQADFFLISINPNNDGQNDTEFLVFSSGTQGDAVVTSNGNEDWGWNAVWDSAVKIVDNGWIAEIRIPYSALRFSNNNIQTWGVNYHRRYMRDNRQYTWNPIDLSSGKKIGLMHGELRGIENINPPTRLSFYPFASGITRSYDGNNDSDFKFGMDLKYGITENFTLDATLVPDFSQAGFDNVQLNLGPFEQQFSEQRQFFTEGVDLFSKGDLFYSRRIGGSPSSYPELNENESVTNYQNNVKVLNAMKLSGRTKNGLGVAFLNAITKKTKVFIKNSDTQNIRTETVEPLANYNILVIDKQFNGNSSVSVVNTNVMRNGGFRDANVTAGLFDINNKKNTYNYAGAFKVSNVNYKGEDKTTTGISGNLGLNKISGNYRFGIDYTFVDEKFDINDIGILRRNNNTNLGAYASYQTFKPTKALNNYRIDMWFNYNRLFKPSTYTSKDIGINFNAQTKKLFDFGGNINWEIGKQYDYWEPRTEGRYFTFSNGLNVNAWIGTNRAKKFSFMTRQGFATLFDKDRDVFVHFWAVDPTFRLTDKFTLSYSYQYNRGNGGRGYVTTADNDDIIFGERLQKTIINSISGTYNFNSFHGLSLTFRNYWSTVDYDYALYTLENDGSTINTTGYNLDNIGTFLSDDPDFNPNVNFNTWNLDFSYSWQFAPGSLLTALYRNSLFNRNTMSSDNFFDSLDTLFDQPIEHIFSLRMVYYIDYNNIKGLFKNKNS
ncbi:DUF5916 domain-containing protein [Pontimicrobium aquaticum]|uniref:Protein with DOMON-like ligand-binding domain protein n=1 Tax=Pontimicrobium aquaticum TaxID=2565367 RepID=A0A4U0EQN7_9FLAO|nr:DUF5916 domain-containing protein [Pontimicrobium aquaticum]TJY33941.1 protein with DOMON-like ligand-binding domain protein [Pontimicrobium aquaticum]